MRGPVGQVQQPDLGQGAVHPLVEFGAAQPEVRGTERDVVAHGGHEQLVVGVLEDHPDPAADLSQMGFGDLQLGSPGPGPDPG